MSIRITSHLLGGFVALAALCAVPAVAQDKSVAGEPLTQALTALSTANGFEVRGLDKVGAETVNPPKSGTPVQALKRILDGYAYTLELAPADPAGKGAGKLLRVSILGHVGDAPAELVAQAGAPAATAATLADGSAAPAPGDDNAPAGPVHPVGQMLRTIAKSSMRLPVGSGAMTGPGQASAPGVAPAAPASTAGGVTGDANSTATDMAALTRSASANLSALVQSLKAACPAGGKC
jgi:hypothetical protein